MKQVLVVFEMDGITCLLFSHVQILNLSKTEKSVTITNLSGLDTTYKGKSFGHIKSGDNEEPPDYVKQVYNYA